MLPCTGRVGASTGGPRPAALALGGALSELLAPVAEWGGVRVTAGNGIAVLQAQLARAACDTGSAEHLLLRGDHHELWLSERGVARIELCEPAGESGAGCSLSWFDGRGRFIAGLSPVSRAGCDRASHWLRRHAASGAYRWPASAAAPVMFAPLVDFVSVDALVRGPAAASWAAAAMLHSHPARTLRMDLGGAGAAMRCSGALSLDTSQPQWLVAGDSRSRLSLRPEQASAVSRVVARDGVRGLLLTDDEGGSLLLHPQGDAAAAWFDAVARQAAGAQAEAWMRWIAQGAQSAAASGSNPLQR
ncbi:hypothetical protein [Rubrivivax sp. A210]|uniref:hypothetical protein n=1 Tax=Rubrivivax sp. A210 TaxID=2772301 RepID=UPI0019186AAE|nr:hypothetical protein [Rubrivivax sp. A210]